jgi:hypothetical protein
MQSAGLDVSWISSRSDKGSILYQASRSTVEGRVNILKGQLDALGNSQQMDMLRLQSLSNKRNEAFDVMSNFIKKMADNRASIIGNMR